MKQYKFSGLLTLFLAVCLQPCALANPSFLTLADIHYGSQNRGEMGQDSGDALLKITLQQVNYLSKQVDFILLLGDLPTHALWGSSTKEAYEKRVFHALYAADKIGKPLFYITGNNDSLSGNYQSFEYKGLTPLSLASDWAGACVYCEGLMIDDSFMRNKGYYSTYVLPQNKDIILIALNTNPWAEIFRIGYPNQEKEALEQLFWLEKQLKKLHAKQLLIAMHIPLGNSYLGKPLWKKPYLQKFLALLEENAASYGQITLLTAHTHMDEIRKIHLKSGSKLYAYSTPSISRNHNNNSGMKVFTLNKQSAIKNFTTYYTGDLQIWGKAGYQALGSSGAIFPDCKQNSLAQCLDEKNAEQVCNALDLGDFYGVKSARVPKGLCKKIHEVGKGLC